LWFFSLSQNVCSLRNKPLYIPPLRPRVRALVTWCGICDRQSRTGACFLRVRRFPLQIIPSIDPHSSTFIIRAWYSRPAVALVIVDSVPLQPTNKNKTHTHTHTYIYSHLIEWIYAGFGLVIQNLQIITASNWSSFVNSRFASHYRTD
jgi:hypothetical protein